MIRKGFSATRRSASDEDLLLRELLLPDIVVTVKAWITPGHPLVVRTSAGRLTG
jgi:hypothetical protein